MPNIEVHGIRLDLFTSVREKIFFALKGAPYASDVVITDMKSEVYDRQGDPQPFLRVVATSADGPDFFEKMGRRLAPLGMDIEMLRLHSFVEKKK